MNRSTNQSFTATCDLQSTKPVYSEIISGGVLISFVSLACNITSADPSLRAILVSFAVANIVSTGIFTYDVLSVNDMCNHLNDSSDFLVTVSMALSICHLTLLTLHFSIPQPAAAQRKATDNCALILTSWISSATLGSMNITTKNGVLKIVVLSVFLLVLVLTVRYHILTERRRKKNERMRRWYKETFLQRNITLPTRRVQIFNGDWNRNVLRIILYGYVGCSLPWMINDLHETIEGNPHYLYRFIFLLLYFSNFYIFSLICICVAWSGCKVTEQKKGGDRAFTTYRYATIFSIVV